MSEEQTVILPALADEFESGTLVAWLKAPGDPVQKDDIIAEIMTDKVNLEIPSPYSGTLKTLLVKEDDTVAVGEALAIIET